MTARVIVAPSPAVGLNHFGSVSIIESMQPKTDPAAHEQRDIAEVARRLATRFPDAPPDTVRAAVEQAHRRFDGAPIRDFVPVFVERSARDALARP